MPIKNYTLKQETAVDAKTIYFPGHEEYADKLEFVERNDDLPNPIIFYNVKEIPNSKVKITLCSNIPLIKHIDLSGENSDIEKIVLAVENDFGIKLE